MVHSNGRPSSSHRIPVVNVADELPCDCRTASSAQLHQVSADERLQNSRSFMNLVADATALCKPESGLRLMIETPVNTSSGSHHLRSGLYLLGCRHECGL